MQNLKLSTEWDKTFPKSEKVNHRKITFHNRYGITLAADMYIPVKSADKLAAIAVCGPFGAVKEQASGLYAQTLAERGFQAAVDFLSSQDNIDAEKIGIVGICGWGGMALNAAALDTRIKAVVYL